MKRIVIALAVSAGLAGPALAQPAPNQPGASGNTGGGQATSSQATSSQAASSQAASPQTTSPQVISKVRQDLAQAGFTDVTVTPAELLVHAKNKDGRPVLMLIGPDSLTELVAPAGGGANVGGSGGNANGR